MAWQSLRGVVEEHDVSERIDLLSEQFPRFAEAWDALKWVLSRNPEPKGSAGKLSANDRRYRAYVLAGDPLAGTPNIWVIYTFDDNQIVILGVEATPLVLDEDE